MLRKLLLLTLPFAALIILSSSMSDNGKAGKTGSPNELTCHDCHSDFTVNTGGGSISIQSPGTPGFQYTPGQTYTMSVTVSKSSVNLFGVGIEALTTANANAGMLNITDAASTQIKNATVNLVSRRNIVHQLNGGIGSGSKIFNFSWTAPAQGTGNVTFYFAGVAANGTGNENGDYVYNSSQVFTELNCATPAQPGTMNGDNTVCSGTSQIYSVATVSGATSYTWTLPSGWTGTSATNSITATTGTSSGSVTVTANNACGPSPQSTFPVTVSSVTATINKTNVSCFGGSNGSATVTPGGGTPGYTYLWSPSGGTAATANNLANGTYTVTVTDAAGCTKTSSVTITQPTVIAVTSTPVNAPCANSNGSITASPTGGTGPYTYNWSPSGGTTATATVPAGSYTVTVTDALGCTKTSSATVTAPTAIVANVTKTNAACANGNGSATAAPTGGTSPYTYAWSPSGGTSATATVAAGTYVVTITDSHSCTSTQSITITQPTPVSVTSSTTNASCTAATGTATAVPTGGTSPYTYSWSTSPVQTTATATNLAGGNYVVTVTDSHGCTGTTNAQVSQPSSLNATSNTVNVSCNGGNNGVAIINVTGGTPTYSFSWNTIPPQLNDTATNLTAGSYTVVVTDNAGCSYSSNVLITEPQPLIVNSGADNSLCNGDSITLQSSVSGGTASYSFQWSPSAGLSSSTDSTPDASPDSTTAYSLTVTDAHGCTSTDAVTITVMATPNAALTMTGDTLFTNTADNYSWYYNGNIITGANTNYYLPVQNGDYYVITSNANGCSDTSAIYSVSTVGINNLNTDESFSIYPNPAGDYLNIIISNNYLNKTAVFYDICGRPVIRIKLTENMNHVDLSGLAKGYYSLVIDGEKYRLSKSILISN